MSRHTSRPPVVLLVGELFVSRRSDGRRYAVGGEVDLDVHWPTPDETIRNAQQVRSAALAPAQPSGQDRAVAAAASQMEAQALRNAQSSKLQRTKR